MPASEDDSPASASAEGPPGERTFAELDALLGRAAAEVQHGLEEGASRIGRYTLLTPVGEGGFGTVWMASQDEPVRRIVALKIFRRDLGQGVVLARFENERQTLARMDHPNIATVLDAGIAEDGRPWFVMPFIDGLPITQLCDERRLSLRERVRLMAEVCDGVQHAHQKGVIHRDLKPGNVLVNRGGTHPIPRVIDFGVAKALEGADPARPRTADGQRLGTPQYMPPEQWLHGAGMADVRSDVYSLGVLLSELLVGGPATRLPRTPLDVPELAPPGTWFADRMSSDPAAAAAVAASRGLDASSLLAKVRGDLDAIVRRAAAPHPDHRYPTAIALAGDLRNWLDGRPVSARLLRPWETVWRFVGRHRIAVAASAVAAAALAAVAAALLWSAASWQRSYVAVFTAAEQSERTFLITRSIVDELLEHVRTERDVGTDQAAFERIESVVDRIAADDPLLAGRMAALIARAHLEASDGRAGYALLERSFDRVVAVDPRGCSNAFRELLPEMTSMAARFDRPAAAALVPAMRPGQITCEALTESRYAELMRVLLFNNLPWPFYFSRPDPDLALASAQWFASMHADPVEAGCVHAYLRINALMRRDGYPDQVKEMRAAVDYLRRNLPPTDLRVVQAEAWLGTVHSIHGFASDDLVSWQSIVAARLELLQGRASPSVSNAYWNLAYSHSHLGQAEQAYSTYLPHLWPTYRRQSPRDGLRPWYLAYFAPLAYRACDLETAYEVAVTQISDEMAQATDTPRDGNSLLSAQVLAAVLADWGDEDAARSIELRFGVARFPQVGPQ